MANGYSQKTQQQPQGYSLAEAYAANGGDAKASTSKTTLMAAQKEASKFVLADQGLVNSAKQIGGKTGASLSAEKVNDIAFKTIMKLDGSLFGGGKLGTVCSVAGDICGYIMEQVGSPAEAKKYKEAATDAERYRIFDEATYKGASKEVFDLSMKIVEHVAVAYGRALQKGGDFNAQAYKAAAQGAINYMRQVFYANYDQEMRKETGEFLEKEKKGGFFSPKEA